MRNIAVVMLTWNQREKSLRCLASLRAAGYPLQRVVLWDNGSVDGTDSAVRDGFPDVVFHRHPRNLGVASGRNSAALLALRVLSPAHLLFLDNDMVVAPGFAAALYEPFADADLPGNRQRQAQSVAKILLLDDPSRIHSAGGQIVNFALGVKRSCGFGEIDAGQYDRRRPCLPSGGATLIASSVFLELGGFDPVFDPFGAEDLDFALRARRAGYRATYVPEAIVYHDYQRKNGAGREGAAYIAARVRQWSILFRRHASPREKMLFCAGGALAGLLKLVLCRLRDRDVAALLGLFSGMRRGRSDTRPAAEAEAADKIGMEPL